MPIGGAGHLSDQIYHAIWANLFLQYAAELRTILVTHPLCGLALTNTTDILSKMCPLKNAEFP